MEIQIKYSPLLEDNQMFANKHERYIVCGYSAHFRLLCVYGGLSNALDWAEKEAKDNLKNFIMSL